MARYPEDDELEKIRTWPMEDFDGWMKFIQSIWAYEDYIDEEDGVWYVSTGGWSGNEEIIQAMRTNESYLWIFHWVSSRRGGHYVLATNAAKSNDHPEKQEAKRVAAKLMGKGLAHDDYDAKQWEDAVVEALT